MKRTHLSEVQTPATSHEQESLAPNSQRFPRQTNADSSARPLHRTTQGWEGGKEIKQGSSIYYLLALIQHLVLPILSI